MHMRTNAVSRTVEGRCDTFHTPIAAPACEGAQHTTGERWASRWRRHSSSFHDAITFSFARVACPSPASHLWLQRNRSSVRQGWRAATVTYTLTMWR